MMTLIRPACFTFDPLLTRLKIFANIVKESLAMAWQALVTNKLRSFLSLLGITIGIICIIGVYTAVDSLEMNMRKSLDRLGNDVVFVQKWPIEFTNDYPWWKYMNRSTTKLSEFNQLKGQSDSKIAGEMAFSINLNNRLLKYSNNSAESVTVLAVSHDYNRVTDFDIASGRYFSDMESSGGRNVVILGNNLAENLFGGTEEALGKDITISGRKANVVGVIKKQGESILGGSFDNNAIIPVNYARNFIETQGDRVNPTIFVKAAPGVSLDELEYELRRQMRNIRRVKPTDTDDFAINRVTMLSEGISNIFGAVTRAGTIIGLFSILVGGFGIANIMFVSVKERTNIIGIQKALGAKNYFILMQFLTESVFLCLIGGLLGILAVLFFSFLARMGGFEIFVSAGNFITGIVISASIGLVFGFIPAWSAARMVPIEAIRTKV